MTLVLQKRLINNYNRVLTPAESLSVRKYSFTYTGLQPKEWLEQYNENEDGNQKLLTIEIRTTHKNRFVYIDLSNDKDNLVMKDLIKAVNYQDMDNFFSCIVKGNYPASLVTFIREGQIVEPADSILQ